MTINATLITITDDESEFQIIITDKAPLVIEIGLPIKYWCCGNQGTFY